MGKKKKRKQRAGFIGRCVSWLVGRHLRDRGETATQEAQSLTEWHKAVWG